MIPKKIGKTLRNIIEKLPSLTIQSKKDSVQGISKADAKDWYKFVEDGKELELLSEENTTAFLKALASLEDTYIKEFIIRHEKTSKELGYEDPFLQAIMGFVDETDQKFNTLANKEVLTVEDRDFIERIAVLLDRQSQMGIDYLKPKKGSLQ